MINIAVDGPSGSGKSSLAKAVARLPEQQQKLLALSMLTQVLFIVQSASMPSETVLTLLMQMLLRIALKV